MRDGCPDSSTGPAEAFASDKAVGQRAKPFAGATRPSAGAQAPRPPPGPGTRRPRRLGSAPRPRARCGPVLRARRNLYRSRVRSRRAGVVATRRQPSPACRVPARREAGRGRPRRRGGPRRDSTASPADSDEYWAHRQAGRPLARPARLGHGGRRGAEGTRECSCMWGAGQDRRYGRGGRKGAMEGRQQKRNK